MDTQPEMFFQGNTAARIQSDHIGCDLFWLLHVDSII